MAIDMESKRGLTAVGNGLRSVLAQVFARGAVWFVFTLALLETLARHAHRFTSGSIALAAGATLLVSTPLLHTERARAEFAPVRFRKLFLAGATSAVALSALPLVGAYFFLTQGQVADGFGWLALAAGLLGSAIGVVRMRAGGVLLGIATTTVLLCAAAVMPSWRNLLLLLATPGALLALPVALARLGPSGEDRVDAGPVRIGAFAPAAPRIADDPGTVEDSDLEGSDAVRETGTSRRLGC